MADIRFPRLGEINGMEIPGRGCHYESEDLQSRRRRRGCSLLIASIYGAAMPYFETELRTRIHLVQGTDLGTIAPCSEYPALLCSGS